MSWNLMPKISNFSNFFVKPTQNLFLSEIDVWIVKFVKLMISSRSETIDSQIMYIVWKNQNNSP